MNYEMFKEKIQEALTACFPPESGISMEMTTEMKINRKVDLLMIKKTGTEKTKATVGQSLNLSYMYEMYEQGVPFGRLVSDCAATIQLFCEDDGVPEFIHGIEQNGIAKDKDIILEKIHFELINTEKNKELLEYIPHRKMLDLSIVYRVTLASDSNGSYGFLVKNGFLEDAGITEEEAFLAAEKNTRDILGINARPMNNVIKSILNTVGSMPHPYETYDMDLDNQLPMWVIGGNGLPGGAAGMLYADILEDLAEKMSGSIYLIPSSVCEIIVIPTFIMPAGEAKEMLLNANIECIPEEEFLSDSLYIYDMKDGRIRIAK